VAQNECEVLASQLAAGAWLACQLSHIQKEYKQTAARILELAAVELIYGQPLLYFRLQPLLDEPPENDESFELESLVSQLVSEADEADLKDFVHNWRDGTDLQSEYMCKKANFELIRPVKSFYSACEALCRHACRRIPELNQLSDKILISRGKMLTRLKRNDEAIELLQHAIIDNPDGLRGEIYQMLAFAQEDKDIEAAYDSMSHAIECAMDNDTRGTRYYNRAAIRINSVNFDEKLDQDQRKSVVADLTQAIKYKTDQPMLNSAYRARAKVYAEDENYDAAIADFSKVIDNADATPRLAVSAWMDRGAIYRQQGRYDEAIADWSKAIWAADANQKQRYRALEARAAAYEKIGQPLAAADDYEAMAEYSKIPRKYRKELLDKIEQLRR
jgi:tetratricopeptide (TPR) repeat protein